MLSMLLEHIFLNEMKNITSVEKELWKSLLVSLKKIDKYSTKVKVVEILKKLLFNWNQSKTLPVIACNFLSANPTKWSNTLKQFVGHLTILWDWRLKG